MPPILRVRDENGNVHDIPAIVGPPGPQGPPGPAGSGAGDARVAKATLPKGRMKGDVDGDGEVSFEDYVLVYDHAAEVNLITDEIALWCGDVSGDNKVNSRDMNMLTAYIKGTSSPITKTPTMADYYGNWTYVKVDDLTGYFYTDIAVEGVTAASSAIVAVQGNHKRDAFAGAECMDGFVRVKANILPVADATCLVFYSPGDGTAVVVPENVVERVGAPVKLLLAGSSASNTKVYTITINDMGVVTATDNDGVSYTFTGVAVTS